MQPEVDFKAIGRRIKTARMIKGMTQQELSTELGCSCNHVSHVEMGKTGISLAMLLKLTQILDQELAYFLLETPYAPRSALEDTIGDQLKQCKPPTLLAVGKMIAFMLEEQKGLEQTE